MTTALSSRLERLPEYAPPAAVATTTDLVLLKGKRGRGSYVRRSDLAALAIAPTAPGRVFGYPAQLATVPTSQNSEEMIRVAVARVAAEVVNASPPGEDCPILPVVTIGRSECASRSDLVALLARVGAGREEGDS